MFARETARLQPLSLQSRHRKGRAQVSPSQVPESVPAPMLFLLPFSGIRLSLNPGPLVPRKSPLINARVSTLVANVQRCRNSLLFAGAAVPVISCISWVFYSYSEVLDFKALSGNV